MSKHHEPTLVWTDARERSPYSELVAQAREEKSRKAAEARRKGREALAEERELRRAGIGVTWRPF